MKSPPYFKLSYNPAQDFISSRWLRVGNSAEYRQALVDTCKQLHKSNAMGWLVDFSRMTSPDMRDQNWTLDLLTQSLPHTKLRKLAVVLPDDLFLEVAVERVRDGLLNVSNINLQIAQFSDSSAAQHWLVSDNDPCEGLFRNAS